MSEGPSYRRALSHRDFRLLAGALTQSAMGDWAYNVALVVYVYEQTHSAAWVAAATLGRMVPRFFASFYGGVIAERFERIHVMVTADLVRFVLMAGLTVVTATDGPAWAAIAVAGLLSTTACVYDPATAAMLPQLLGEEQLAAGNAITEGINNIAIIAGPGIGAVVLALGSPSIVMGMDAVTFLVSALLVSRIRARSVPTDVTQDGGVLKQMSVGVLAIVRSSTAALLVSFTVVSTFLYGVDTVLYVFLSRDRLGTGASGYGYLLVALGIGGVIAAAFVNKLAALPRLSAVLAFGMVAFTLPTLVLVWSHSPAVAVAVQIVRGIATLIVDVLAMTALQRSLPSDLIARVFGVFWALVIGGLALGALIAPFLLNGLGLNATLYLDALVVPALVLVTYPRLASLDRLASSANALLAPRVALFATLDIFAAAPRPVLERLARAADEVRLEPGGVLIREGETADALYVLAEGSVNVSARGERSRSRRIRTMTGPSYIGEIGLLEGVSRTATVKAATGCTLWRIDGDTFLSALTESTLSPSFVSGMTLRLKRTHPSHELTLPAQRAPIDFDNSLQVETARS